MAALENKGGNFVLPSAANAVEALEEAKFNKVLAATVPDPTGAERLSDRELHLGRVPQAVTPTNRRRS